MLACLRWTLFAWLLGLAACQPAPGFLPHPPKPLAGFWFDAFRDHRMRLPNPELLAGAAKVKLTPRPGGIIAGHGFNKHSLGVLDDLYARVLYLDGGRDAVVLVSLDFVGFTFPRVERIRARVSEKYADRILIASTHNHDGPDTLGYWGPAVLYFLPVRSGVDPGYLDWVEQQVADAILEAVGNAKPARVFAGRFLAPEGLTTNLREPGVVDRTAQVLRLAGRDGFTIGTVVTYSSHAESLQDLNRWISADFPGVLCREVDRALGGVTLFFTAPAGGMIEPNDQPEDPEAYRIAFRDRMGGALAEGTILQAVGGMEEIAPPILRVRTLPLRLPVQLGGLLDLAFSLGLLEPRPILEHALQTEMALLDLGKLQLLTIPGEPTIEVGRTLAGELRGPYRMVIGVALDELGYILSDRQWQDERFEYERSMSLGPGTAARILEATRTLVAETGGAAP